MEYVSITESCGNCTEFARKCRFHLCYSLKINRFRDSEIHALLAFCFVSFRFISVLLLQEGFENGVGSKCGVMWKEHGN